MADKAAAAADAPKKKGKLPMILVVALVLGGGGFFMLGGKKEKKAEPELALGEIIPFEEKFLVNLRDQDTYLQASIAVHLDKHFKKEAFEKNLAAVQSAVVLRLSTLSKADAASEEGKLALKRLLALDMNRALEALAEDHGEEKKDDKKKKKKDEHEEEELTDVPADEREFPQFDSESGPVLKVYFTSFAMQ